jgi:hypothetical protein
MAVFRRQHAGLAPSQNHHIQRRIATGNDRCAQTFFSPIYIALLKDVWLVDAVAELVKAEEVMVSMCHTAYTNRPMNEVTRYP